MDEHMHLSYKVPKKTALKSMYLINTVIRTALKRSSKEGNGIYKCQEGQTHNFVNIMLTSHLACGDTVVAITLLGLS
jgi:hypothetical protein